MHGSLPSGNGSLSFGGSLAGPLAVPPSIAMPDLMSVDDFEGVQQLFLESCVVQNDYDAGIRAWPLREMSIPPWARMCRKPAVPAPYYRGD